MDPIKVGQLILELRKKNNLTQAELAERLGVTSQAVSKWENGRGIPDIEFIRKISKEFNIDVLDILDGEKRKKKSKFNIKILIIILLFLILLTFLILIVNNNNTFIFSNLSSENSAFEIKGVVAFSNDKKSIYISNIDYINEEDESKEYVVMECSLYEKHDSFERKISQCGHIDQNKNYFSKDGKSLKELLSTIEFSVDDYKSSCKKLIDSDLYIVINALNTDDKIITYKIPLKLQETCSD